MVRELIGHALALLYPPRCAFCDSCLPLGSPAVGICPDCEASLPRAESGCGIQVGDTFLVCLSPLFYRAPASESICRYKFAGRACYHQAYGPLLRDYLARYLERPPELITWAPLNRWRRYRRGYDQSLLLAQEAAALYGMEPVRLLEKRRNTRRQSSLSRQERKKNVEGVYRMHPKAPPVAGKRILLVDDVVTSGSTLSACATVLLQAGAADVVCLTLARSYKDIDTFP